MEIFKMGMVVDLEICDLSIYRFQTMPVAIYTYDFIQKESAKDSNPDQASSTDTDKLVFNSFLSGTYIVYSIQYTYNVIGPIKQRLTLLKREFNKPT